jgi:hypothetical protein
MLVYVRQILEEVIMSSQSRVARRDFIKAAGLGATGTSVLGAMGAAIA